MRLTISEKSKGIKIAWFFMVITIGGLLNDLKTASEVMNNSNMGFDGSFELGYNAGGKLALIFFLGIGMLLYMRTRRRKLDLPVWGPKFIDYFLVFILSINFINLLATGAYAYGTGDDVLAFFYITSSLVAYVYVLLAKPRPQNHRDSAKPNKLF